MSSANYLTTSPLQVTQATVSNEPTNQATFDSWVALTSPTSDTQIKPRVNINNGAVTADGFLVVGKIGGYHTGSPADGTVYVAGNSVGTDGTVLYIGAGTFVAGTLYDLPCSSLTAGQRYYLTIYTYRGAGIAVNYKVTAPLQINNYTTSTEPAAHPTADVVVSPTGIAGITSDTITLRIVPSGTGPVATKFLVVRKTGGYHTGTPLDQTTYSVGNTLGDGTVCFYGAGDSVVGGKKDLLITGLTVNTTYYFTIYAAREDV